MATESRGYAPRIARRGTGPAAIDGEHVGRVVVQDVVAGGFVRQHATPVAAQHGVAHELHGVGFPVVFQDFSFAFDGFVHPFPLLPEIGQLAGPGGCHAELRAAGVLPHIHTGGADQQRAFGDHDIAGEQAGLAQVVVSKRIRLDIHRLVAIRLFGMGGTRRQRQGQQGRQQRKAMEQAGVFIRA